MMSKHRVGEVISLVCFIQHVLNCVGQSGVYLNITRQNNGDLFTISNESNSSCERMFAVNIVSFSKENCTAQCECKPPHKTYNIRLGKCAADEEILNFENCNGSFLPSSAGTPLYDLSKPGKAQLKVLFLNNQSYCHISSIAYLNRTNEIRFTNNETAAFNISGMLNSSVFLSWNAQNSSSSSQLQHSGYLLKLCLICSKMTSQHQRSCFIIKTRGRIVKKIDLTPKEHRKIQDICFQKPKKSTNVMLLYLFVGLGCAGVVIAVLVACYACYLRRRRLQPLPRNSSRTAVVGGTRKPFKTRSVTKMNNGPTTPAIHDVIFNELSWDGDGGFSNRALADPRVLEVDYGIPIDFGTLPRPESTTSFDSTRHSLSPLTDIREHGQRKV